MTATLGGGKKTFNKALNQDLEMQTANIAAEMSSRVQQTKARIFWSSQSPPAEQRLPTAYVLVLWEHSPLLKGLPT
jgi:hypothetical protein